MCKGIRAVLGALGVCAVALWLRPVAYAGEACLGEVWPRSSLEYGEPLESVALDGFFYDGDSGEPVEGVFTWSDPHATMPVGRQRVSYLFAPRDSSYGAYQGGVEVAVEPRRLEVYVVGAATKEYDGDSTTVPESIFCDRLVDGDEVEVTAVIHYRDAAAAQLKPVDRVEPQLGGPDSGNYRAHLADSPAQGAILPYRATCEPAIIQGEAGSSYSGSLADLLPLSGPETTGAVIYSGPTGVDGDADIFLEQPQVSGGRLRFVLGEGTAGKAATLSFTLQRQNYRPVETQVRVEVVGGSGTEGNRVEGVSAPGKVYDGKAYQPVGTPVVGGAPVEQPVWRYTGRGETVYDSAEPPAAAGEYTLRVAAGERPGAAAQVLEFVVHRAALRITPADCELVAGEPLPAKFALEYEGFVQGEGAAVLDPAPLVEVSAADSQVPGVYTLAVTNKPVAANYSVVCTAGRLVIWGAQGDERHIAAPEPGVAGWYREPPAVGPALPELYHEIALSPEGPFAEQVVLEQTGVQGVLLYFRGKAGASAGIPFAYRLDMDPPVIEGVSCDAVSGAVTVMATDALSGVASIALAETPSGIELPGQGGVFAIEQSGRYTVTVTDAAGNRAAGGYELSRDNGQGQGEPSPEPQDSSKGKTGGGSGWGGSFAGAGGDAGSAALLYGETQDFWSGVNARLRAAKPGETVRVMSAARIPALDPAAVSFTIDEVLAMLLPETQGEEAEAIAFAGPPTYLSQSTPQDGQDGREQAQEMAEETPLEEEDHPSDQPQPPPETKAVTDQWAAEMAYAPADTVIPATASTPSPAPAWILGLLLGAAALTLAGLALKMGLK